MKLPDGTATPKATPASEDVTPKVDTLRLENLREPATKATVLLVSGKCIADHSRDCTLKGRVRRLTWWVRGLVISLALLVLAFVATFRWHR